MRRQLCGQTKAIVSVATLMLQEEGKLLLSDPVDKYLPEFMETTVAVARREARPYISLWWTYLSSLGCFSYGYELARLATSGQS
ncbi:MAG: serine hydrolase [Woeseiaceae bacterium]